MDLVLVDEFPIATFKDRGDMANYLVLMCDVRTYMNSSIVMVFDSLNILGMYEDPPHTLLDRSMRT